MAQVQTTLDALASREEGPFIARLPRAAGERESRYGHLFSGAIEWTAPAQIDEAVGATAQETVLARVSLLEALVAEMRRDIEALKAPPAPTAARTDLG
jgi:uncharacterized protein YceH (UPF0502 family)